MKITGNFKTRLKKAKKEGYTHLSSTASNEYTTTYYHFELISDLLKCEIGENRSYGRYNGVTITQFLTQYPGSKIIGYQDCFK
jgi:hypothetical protein